MGRQISQTQVCIWVSIVALGANMYKIRIYQLRNTTSLRQRAWINGDVGACGEIKSASVIKWFTQSGSERDATPWKGENCYLKMHICNQKFKLIK